MPLVVASDPVPLAADVDGVLRIGKTRVSLATVVFAFCDGATAEEILQQYPSLQLGDVYSVIGYYLNQKAEVDAYLAEREKVAARVQQDNEIRFDPNGVRERLLARRTPQG
jgi:uncharacterized protein (DUF433 family)